MQKTCTACGAPFTITDWETAFRKKMSPTFDGKRFELPEPDHCPDCRQRQRMAIRNERHLYRRKCDACKKDIVSIYDGSVPFPVFCYDCWWSDVWDAMSFGMTYDPARPFFDQFGALFAKVPRLGYVTGHNENCDYCNYTNYSKSSYLCFGCHNVEYGQHCWRAHWSHDCADCLQIDRSNHCYELIDCDECYNLLFSQDCDHCIDSAFLYDCKNCEYCLLCTGLRSKKYCILNEQLTPKEYQLRREQCRLSSHEGIETMRKLFAALKVKQPHRNIFIINAENVSGDHIAQSRNVFECYHTKEAEDCMYLESCEKIKDSMDNTFSGWPAERIYETMSAGVNCYNHIVTTASWSSSDILYCDSCHHSSRLFGCVGLTKKNSYCILNMQYTKEDYEKLAASIIQSMVERNEWGKFFPLSLIPHAYNETSAEQFYPLKREEAERFGYRWKELQDHVGSTAKTIPASQLPDSLEGNSDDILTWVIECEITKWPFRIVRQELEFYQKMHLPIPHFHPDERHRRRMALRNPRRLWKRECGKCGKPMETTYSPDRPEKVYCETCYLKEVY